MVCCGGSKKARVQPQFRNRTFQGAQLAVGNQKRSMFFSQQKEESTCQIMVKDYSPKFYEEREAKHPEDCFKYVFKDSVTWINVEGIDAEVIKLFAKHYNIHELLIEDIIEGNERPRGEAIDEQLFISCKMLTYLPKEKKVDHEQISILLGKGFVLTFQEGKEGDVFGPILEKLRFKRRDRLRQSNESYLFYVIINQIIKAYNEAIDSISNDLDRIEASIIIDKTNRSMTSVLYEHKRNLTQIRKQAKPLWDLIKFFYGLRLKTLFEVRFELKDLISDCQGLIEDIDSKIDLITNLIDLYLAILGNKTNEIMKFLTIMSSFFIPLTFLAGVYGENFEYIPETVWRYGYLTIWVVMALLVAVIYVFFKFKKWL